MSLTFRCPPLREFFRRSQPKRLVTVKLSKKQIDELQVEPLAHLPSRDQLFQEETEQPQTHCGSRFVMREKNAFRLFWSIVLCCLLFYTSSIFLFRFTFYDFHIGLDGHSPIRDGEEGWLIADWIVDVLFWMDLVIMFFFSYCDEKGREVDSLQLIAINYLSFYFWLNLLACIPPVVMQWLLRVFSGGDSHDSGVNPNAIRVYRLQQISRMTRITRVARLARTARLVKIVAIFKNTNLWRHVHSFRGLRVLNFFTGLMWFVHVLACGWYLCAALHDDVENTWVARRPVDWNGRSLLTASPGEQWITSMYFVLTVFTTVGFGDISAMTVGEMYYAAFTMLVGAVVQSLIISEVIGIVTSQDEVQKVITQQEALIENYSRHAQLTPEITKELKNEVAWRSRHWVSSYGFDKGEMKGLLTGQHVPRWLLAKMPKNLWNGALVKNALLAKVGKHGFLQIGARVPSRLPCLLAIHLVMCEFSAGETIYQMGDFPFTLFLVASGTFSHVAVPTKHGGIDAMLPEEDEDEDDGCEDYTGCNSKSTATSTTSPPLHSTWSNLNKVSNMEMGENALFPYRLFSQHSYFGDTEVIWGKPRFATTRCERDGVALTLHKADFLEVQEMFPQFKAAWATNARRHERFRAHCLGKLKTGQSYKRLAGLQILKFMQRMHAGKAYHPEPERSTAPLYVTGMQPPLSENRQTQAALEKLNAKMELVLEALGRRGDLPLPPNGPKREGTGGWPFSHCISE